MASRAPAFCIMRLMEILSFTKKQQFEYKELKSDIMAGLKSRLDKVLVKKGLTHVVQNICSHLDFEDTILFIYSNPGLVKMAKSYKSVIYGPHMPNDNDLDTIFRFMDQLTKDDLSTLDRHKFLMDIMKKKSLSTFKVVRRFRGDDFFDLDSISSYGATFIMFDFMEKVIEENDLDTFCFLNERLYYTRRTSKRHPLYRYHKSKTSRMPLPQGFDENAYCIADELGRQQICEYYEKHIWKWLR